MNTPLLHRPARTRLRARTAPFAAFTLVEILIAMAIFSLVLAAIYSTWTAILRASRVGQDAAAAVQRARITSRIIEESLASAQSFAQNQDLYGFVAQNGSDAYLSFVARLASSFPRSGKFGDFDLRRVTFSLEEGSGHAGELVLRQSPLLMDLDVDEREHPLVLARNVKEFKSEFWDERLHDWTDEWTKTNQLPRTVRVSLQLADNPHSSMVRETVTCIVDIPSVSVPPGWQTPMSPAGPGPLQNLPPRTLPPGVR